MAWERLNELEKWSKLNATEGRVLNQRVSQDAETRAAQAAAREREAQRKAEQARLAKEEQEQQRKDAERIMWWKLWDVVSSANSAINWCKEAGITDSEIIKLKDKNRGAIRENWSLNCMLLNSKRDTIRVSYKTMDWVTHPLDIKTKDVVKAKPGVTWLGLLDKSNYIVDMKKIMKLVNDNFKTNEALAWKKDVDKVVEEWAENLQISKLEKKSQKYLRDNDLVFNGKMDFKKGFGDGIAVVNWKLMLWNITFNNLHNFYKAGKTGWEFKEVEFAKALDDKLSTLADKFYAKKFSESVTNLSKNYWQMDADSLAVQIRDLDTQVRDAKNIWINLEDKTNTLAKAKDLLKEKREKAAASKEFDRVFKIYDKEYRAIKRSLDSRNASEVERDQAKTKLENYAKQFKGFRIGSNMTGPRWKMNLVDVIKKSENPSWNRAKFDELRNRYINKAKLHRLDV